MSWKYQPTFAGSNQQATVSHLRAQRVRLRVSLLRVRRLAPKLPSSTHRCLQSTYSTIHRVKTSVNEPNPSPSMNFPSSSGYVMASLLQCHTKRAQIGEGTQAGTMSERSECDEVKIVRADGLFFWWIDFRCFCCHLKLGLRVNRITSLHHHNQSSEACKRTARARAVVY